MALTDNLVAYYKLDWNSNDSIWAFNWTDTSISYVTGKINQWASFNGTSSRIQVGNLPLSSAFTFCAFVYVNSWTNDGWLYSKRDGWSNSCFSINQSATASNWNVVTYLWNPSFWYTSSWSGFLSLWSWLHIWITFDGTNVRYYKNASLFNTAIDPWNILTTSLSTRFWDDWFSHFSNMILDEVYISFDAKSITEIAQLYNWWNGLSYPFSLPVTSNLFPFFYA